MKILGMGGLEFVIILVVILLIFGPKNLPKLGNALGKTVSNLRAGMNEGKKKDKESEAEQPTADAQEVSVAAPAELVGEVEGAANEAVSASEGEVIDAAAQATFDAEAAVDEVFEPKRVKRVVRKKPVE